MSENDVAIIEIKDWNNNLGFEYQCFFGFAQNFHKRSDNLEKYILHLKTEDFCFLLGILFLTYSFDWSIELILPDKRAMIYINDETTNFYGDFSSTFFDAIRDISRTYSLSFETF